MKRRMRSLATLVTLTSMIVTGCAPSRTFYFNDDDSLNYYKGVATEIEYPDTCVPSLDDVTGAIAPLTVANNEPTEFWDLTLEEAIKNALANSKVMRQLGGQLSSNAQLSGVGQQVLTAPQQTPTVYLPALTDSDPRFGTEGVLSAFDAQFTSGLFWEKNDRPINLDPALAIFSRTIFEQDLGTFNSEISKVSTAGTRFFARHNVGYDWNNNPSNFFPSVWTANVEAEFRHPLLQGAGVDYNRIAGPNGIPGFYNGVVIARINTDIALADFEAGIRNVVADTESAYWTLYEAYRNLDANVAGRDSALQTWRKVNVEAQVGKSDAAQEAQAREQYFLFRGQVEAALSDLYQAENRLRYMMGLAATDGRLARPADEPTTAKILFDWQEVNTEALARAVELRRQRWLVKRREMELAASKNFLLPRLDAVGRYRWRGFGDDLLDPNGDEPEFDNAYQTLLDGKFQEWQLGFNLTVPIGFRQALSGVRNAQLYLARERAVLQEQELELSHQLANAIRDLDRHYMLSQTNFNRRAAAKRQVEAVQQNYDVGRITLDQLLDAQRRLADAEGRYFSSLSSYNRAITQIHFRKGSLLEYNGVLLAEGPWTSKAYYDAEQSARRRDAGHQIDYGFTRPQVFSQGPIEQFSSPVYYDGEVIESSVPVEMESVPLDSTTPEGLPTPAPLRMPTPPTPQASPTSNRTASRST
jgi:outer membrane protein TolC